MVPFDDRLRESLDISEVSKLANDIQGDRKHRETVLFWGAGCSVSSGIHTCSGFVDYIAEEYKRAVRRCKGEKTEFQNLMRTLDEREHRQVIGAMTIGKVPNWSHILAIWLMKSKFIHRIYTLNFDSLLLEAASLLGYPVNVYDFAAIPLDRPDLIESPAIVYLHGQRHGFRQRVFPKEGDSFEKLFGYAEEKRQRWIVIGYSGSNDRIFPLFRDAPGMESIHWVAHRTIHEGKDCLSLSPAVLDLLKDPDMAVSTIPARGSDQFMRDLAEHLGSFPPPLFLKPAEHMDSLIGKVGHLRLSKVSITSFSSEVLARIKPDAGDAADTLLLERFFGAARSPVKLLKLCDEASSLTLPESFQQLAAELLIAEVDRLRSVFWEALEDRSSNDAPNYASLQTALSLLEAALLFVKEESLRQRFQSLSSEIEEEQVRSQTAASAEPSAPSESARPKSKAAIELDRLMAMEP